MTPDALSRAWAKQAQLDAERGVIACRMCRREAGLDETTSMWRNGQLVFALCDRCAGAHQFILANEELGDLGGGLPMGRWRRCHSRAARPRA